MWPHDYDTLTCFLEHADNAHPNIKFTHKCSTTISNILFQVKHDKIVNAQGTCISIYVQTNRENAHHNVLQI